LRATVDWSYSLLNEVEQRVFERLAVFSGTFDAIAARSVVAGGAIEAWDVLDALASLVSKSMLTADQAPTGETRHGMLETLRQYARERLDESGEADGWRRRHAEYFAAFAETVGPALTGPDELQWRPRLYADLDNVRTAYTWGLDRDRDADTELGLRVLAGLGLEAQLNRSLGMCAWAERAFPIAPQVRPSLRTAIYALIAWHAITRAENDRAREVALEAVEGGSDLTVQAAPGLWSALGYVATSRGDLEEMRWAMERAQAHGPAYAVATRSELTATWAMLELGFGEASTARRLAEEAVTGARASGNPSALAMALYAKGWATDDVDPDGARTAYEESVELHRKGTSDSTFSSSLIRLAPLRLRSGDPRGGIDALVEALVVSGDTGDRQNQVFGALLAASVLGSLGQLRAMSEVVGIVDGAVIAPAFPKDPVLGAVRARASELAGEADFAEAHARGAAMDYEGATSYVLEVLEQARAALPDEAT
jgi:hypothetical protein